ncbi:hypothetical protein EYV96_16290 [Dyella terrae]|uniref:Uncharacterized protein n=1 Tax=Dyella terrae TaxID=522259 RepID=A0ABY1YSW4_9GAMM|nr:hypothetical protein [Dyella soli]TBR36152.1 hypothetical protein EYV96_16290 [Dyella terrae]
MIQSLLYVGSSRAYAAALNVKEHSNVPGAPGYKSPNDLCGYSATASPQVTNGGSICQKSIMKIPTKRIIAIHVIAMIRAPLDRRRAAVFCPMS